MCLMTHSTLIIGHIHIFIQSIVIWEHYLIHPFEEHSTIIMLILAASGGTLRVTVVCLDFI